MMEVRAVVLATVLAATLVAPVASASRIGVGDDVETAETVAEVCTDPSERNRDACVTWAAEAMPAWTVRSGEDAAAGVVNLTGWLTGFAEDWVEDLIADTTTAAGDLADYVPELVDWTPGFLTATQASSDDAYLYWSPRHCNDRHNTYLGETGWCLQDLYPEAGLPAPSADPPGPPEPGHPPVPDLPDPNSIPLPEDPPEPDPSPAGTPKAPSATVAPGSRRSRLGVQVASGTSPLTGDPAALTGQSGSRVGHPTQDLPDGIDLVVLTSILAATVGLGAIRLYRRVSKDDALDNEIRSTILETVRRRPGTTPSELADELGVALNTVLYHARILEELDYLTVDASGRPHRLFVPGHQARTVRELSAALRSKGKGDVLRAVRERGEARLADLARRLDRHPSTVKRHADALVEAGLLADVGEGRARRLVVSSEFEDGDLWERAAGDVGS